MNPVRFFFGCEADTPLAEALARSASLRSWKPFDPRAVAFVADFSRAILRRPQVRTFPELAALAHWFRGSRLKELQQAQADDADRVRLGRGLAFHIAPANVDSVAMYSLLLSLLAGNVNWVRVSQKISPQLEFILATLHQLTQAASPGTAELAQRLVILTYPHDAEITSTISEAAMLRVVWGGDATVKAIRAIALRPTATEICFPDRFSCAALNARALLQLQDDAWPRIASAFYNDAFWFAQQACSSPRTLAWVGTVEDCAQARARFWPAIQAELQRREAENTPAMTMARLAASFEMAAAQAAHVDQPASLGGFPTVLQLDGRLTSTLKDMHCGNGLFLEHHFERLDQLAPQLSDKEQTLTVFGFAREELLALIEQLPSRAVDRIATLGDALTFAPAWDGMDLIATFSRIIQLPGAHQLRQFGATES